ncbi:MAG: TIGR03905 family TSCPD domain-containing protein [Muribaculaceae bacterium]|nr:TIGR03905 family TSCPD domain-containing protein [Muribaculaceae bacterium]
MKYTYNPQGTCSRHIEFEVEDGCLADVSFTGGCHGNLQGISALVKGMEVGEVIKRLRGIKCGTKNTSCPDQLAQALEQIN